MPYTADSQRYERMPYSRCGQSGIQLPVLSLGLWHNFGHVDPFQRSREIIFRAFDLGINHFDLANNYGPPAGSAEENFGRILKQDLAAYRDELIISSKAGFYMWPGPYGEWGSRKYLIASLDQSLRRLGLDYVDIFYSHRPDPDTPLEETMSALALAYQQGKALYVGLSNYGPEQTTQAAAILRDLGVPCLIHQPKYSMLVREPEEGLFDVLDAEGIGCIVFSPLAQGLLTGKYLQGIPEDSRAAKAHGFLQKEEITQTLRQRLLRLHELAQGRGQSLAQLAIAWTQREPRVTSTLIGVSSVKQLEDNYGALEKLELSEEECQQIDKILAS